MGIREDICGAIDRSGLTLYRIAADLEMNYGTLHRLVSGKTDARLVTLDLLADYLGLTLQPKPKRKKR